MLLKSEKYCYESLEINGLIYTMLTFRFTRLLQVCDCD